MIIMSFKAQTTKITKFNRYIFEAGHKKPCIPLLISLYILNVKELDAVKIVNKRRNKVK